MENKDSCFFLDLIEIGLLRKVIFQKIFSFRDICNLGKTCNKTNFLINNDKIRRDFMCYEDKQIIEIKFKESSQNDLNIIKLEDIEFEKYNNSFERLDELKMFNGETICLKSCINFYIEDVVEDFEKNERLLFIKKLVEELSSTNQIRRDVKVLNFLIDSFDNHDIILHALSFINHSNIRRIEVPDSIFIAESKKYEGLTSNIFENLPKFHELVIYITPSVDTYRRLLENKSIIEKVLKELSKKRNATLILANLYHYYNKIVPYVDIFLKFTKKYKIKIKCNVNFNCNEMFNRRCRNCLNEICIFYPIKELVTSLKFESANFGKLLNVMKNWQYFTNLESLELSVFNIDIKKCLEKVNISNCTLFLKNCTKLKKVILNLRSSFNGSTTSTVQIVHNNLKFLVNLMPDTIRIFELINVPDLSENLTSAINMHMPNLRILTINHVSFQDPDCLNCFENLECCISSENYIINVPPSVKLFGVGHKNSKSINNNDNENVEIMNTYSKRYSKCLRSINDQYIFFNEIKYWDMYKDLIQDILD